ncbi:hypothetical protein EGW08_015333 [Elysia chlorotica]|uniref:Reverse transcriptase domain-containing protein n=1 Tax=Elysia chlorotica TaxID=188477 RepID=A0A3S0ZE77_ELYCH|nr:hypothetical protein EGW08_015333 [Elysia chlorotica]
MRVLWLKILRRNGCSMSVEVCMSALRASGGISSGPAAFPDLRDFMALTISDLLGGLVLMSRSSVGGGISGGASGAEIIFRNINELPGMNISGQNINNIRYADDTALVAETPEQLQALLDKVNEESEKCGLAMNAKKTKVMVISRKDITPKININIGNTVLEQVSTFIYLGQLISDDNRADQDIKRRIGIAKTSFNSLLNTFTSNSISMKTKLQLLKTFVWSTLLYGSETWSISKAQMNKIEAFEMYAFRRIGKISWRQKLTNYEVLQKLNIRREIGQCIRDRKLQYYGHLMRHESVIRDLYNGEVEGSRGRGRPRTKWNDNIAEWTCYSLVQCQRLAQDRCQWRAIAANLRKETAPG